MRKAAMWNLGTIQLPVGKTLNPCVALQTNKQTKVLGKLGEGYIFIAP